MAAREFCDGCVDGGFHVPPSTAPRIFDLELGKARPVRAGLCSSVQDEISRSGFCFFLTVWAFFILNVKYESFLFVMRRDNITL